jgi:hypothetical protein
MQPNIVLFDIDNTLADMDHRLHYMDREVVDWDEFEDEAVYDQPIRPSIMCAQAWNAMGKQVWCWSGRRERIRGITETWLRFHGVPYTQLLLKPDEEETPAALVKLRWLTQSPVPQERVICAFDDDPRVVKVLREKGKIQVFQVMRPT